MTTNQLMLGATPSTTSDPYFSNVVLLMQGGGTVGGGTQPIVDSSTNNYSFNTNVLPQGSFAPYGESWSVYFKTSTTDYINTASSAVFAFGTGNFTIEGWVNYSGVTAVNQALVCMRAQPTSYSNYVAINSSGYIQWSNGTTWRVATTVTPVNTWTHFAVVRSSGTLTIYINGVASGSFSETINISGNRPCFIGGSDDSAFRDVLNGYLSNIRVNNTALYTSAFVPSTTPLQAVSGTVLLTCQSNQFIDNSPNNFTITQTGSPKIQTACPFSNASLPTPYYSGWFDGTGDYLTFPQNAAFNFSSNSFTIECWVYFNNTTGTQPVFALDTTSYPAVLIQSESGIIKAYATSASTSWDMLNGTTFGSVTAGKWYHLALTRSGTTFRTFLNGSLVTTVASTSVPIENQGNAGRVGTSDLANYINGCISNFRIVNGTALYTSNFTPSTTPLTAVSGTVLLTCQSSQFIDNSSNNFTITVNGNAQPKIISPFTPTYITNQTYSPSIFGGSGLFVTAQQNYLQRNISSTTDGMYLQGTTYSLEAWVNMTSTTGIQVVYGSCASNVTNFGQQTLTVENGVPKFSVRPTTGGTLTTISGGTVTANVWTHLAVVVNAGSGRLYVNGQQVGSTTTITAATFTPTRIGIGMYGNLFTTGITYFSGYMSDIRVVQGVAIYKGNFAPQNAPLTAISGTGALLNFSSAAIYDNSRKNDWYAYTGSVISSTSKFGTSSIYMPAGLVRTWYAPLLMLGTTDFTIEGWINRSASPTIQGVLAKGAYNSTGWEITSTPKLRFTFTTTNITGTTDMAADTWYHFAVVRSGTAVGNVKLYLNGNLEATSSTAVTTNFNQTDQFEFGSNRGSTNDLTGYLDNVRITAGIARYTSSFTPPTAPFPSF